MKKFKLEFTAKKAGAIGIEQRFERTVEALDAEGALFALYEEFDHVRLYRRTELSCAREPDDDGTSGQDRESYSDDQDRDSYAVPGGSENWSS